MGISCVMSVSGGEETSFIIWFIKKTPLRGEVHKLSSLIFQNALLFKVLSG